jgi:hypothetical protein
VSRAFVAGISKTQIPAGMTKKKHDKEYKCCAWEMLDEDVLALAATNFSAYFVRTAEG